MFLGFSDERYLQKKVMYARDKLLSRMLDAAAGINKRKHQLRRTASDLSTRAAKFIEGDGGILEYLRIV